MTESGIHNYLLRFSFLGFRFQGWQHQPGVKSVEGMIQKTLGFVLPGRKVKVLGSGRTDARVSATGFVSQLLVTGEPLVDLEDFTQDMNRNLPPDILLESATSVPKHFNAIRDSQSKTYRYYFCFGTKPHPFCAPFLGYFPGPVDLNRMINGASIFVGAHNFRGFIAQPGPKTRQIREITASRILPNKELTASFFPDSSYFLEISGPGFGRYQVRMIMAALIALGRGEINEENLRKALLEGDSPSIKSIAPGSGLHLIRIQTKQISE